MKGPGLRLNIDVRRIWHCPVCNTKFKSRGSEVSRRCHHCEDRPWMKLIEPSRPPSEPRVEKSKTDPETE